MGKDKIEKRITLVEAQDKNNYEIKSRRFVHNYLQMKVRDR